MVRAVENGRQRSRSCAGQGLFPCPGLRSAARPLVVVVIEDPLASAVEILILSGAQGPQEGNEAEGAEEQGCRDENEQHVHRAKPSDRRSRAAGRSAAPGAARRVPRRMALAMTMTEEADIA